MITAITRAVSPSLGQCELEYLARQEIDIAKAVRQHAAYQACLTRLGAEVVSLPAVAECPDAVFVEDPAIVVEETAVMTRMGAATRRKESESLADALSKFRTLLWIREPATIEGGDVMRIGKTLYVGLSRRTNREGIEQLQEMLKPFGYRIEPVPVRGCLHLKSACCYLGDRTILANPAWIDSAALADFKILEVPAEEPGGANVLRIGETVIVSSAFPKTAEQLEAAGFQITLLDTSELQKAEAGITCMSLLLQSPSAVLSA